MCTYPHTAKEWKEKLDNCSGAEVGGSKERVLELRKDPQRSQERTVLQQQCHAGHGAWQGDTTPGRSAQECLSVSFECWDCEEGSDQDSWFLISCCINISIVCELSDG